MCATWDLPLYNMSAGFFCHDYPKNVQVSTFHLHLVDLQMTTKILTQNPNNFGKKGKAINVTFVQTRIKLLDELWQSVSKSFYDCLKNGDGKGKRESEAEVLYEEHFSTREDYCLFQSMQQFIDVTVKEASVRG